MNKDAMLAEIEALVSKKTSDYRQALARGEVHPGLTNLVSLVKQRATSKGVAVPYTDVDLARGAYFDEGPAAAFCDRVL